MGWLLGILLIGFVLAVGVYNHNVGSYVENFNDTADLTLSGTLINGTTLVLMNSSSSVSPPFLNGSALTDIIIPQSVVQWGTIAFSGTIPANTTVRIRVLDSDDVLFNDSLLPGNENGFTTSPIDLSALAVEIAASRDGAKFGRLRLNISLETNNTNQTPVLDNLTVSWTARQGDLSAAPTASTAWPTEYGQVNGGRQALSSAPAYPTIRWVRDFGVQGDTMLSAWSDRIIVKMDAGIISWPTVTLANLVAMNPADGSLLWEKPLSGASFVRVQHTLSSSGAIISADIYNDIITAHDVSDGSLRWTYSLGSGHNGYAGIAPDGNILYTKHPGTGPVFRALNSSGHSQWNTSFSDVEPVSGNWVFTPGRLYTWTSYSNATCADEQRRGYVHALNATDGSLLWNYPTAGLIANMIVDNDDTVYVVESSGYKSGSHSCPVAQNRLLAFNPDGSLKWNYSFGASDNATNSMALLGTDRLALFVLLPDYVVGGEIRIINRTTGTLVTRIPAMGVYGYLSSELATDTNEGILYSRTNDTGFFGGGLSYLTNYSEQWRFTAGKEVPHFIIADGAVYAALLERTQPNNLWIAKIVNWTVTGWINDTTTGPGCAVRINATTTMNGTDPWSGSPNQVQAVLSTGERVALVYNHTDAQNRTVWTGIVNLSLGVSEGNYSYQVQAMQPGIMTNFSTSFAAPSPLTNNTGIVTNGTFSVTYAAACGELSPRIDVPVANSVHTGNVTINVTFNGTANMTGVVTGPVSTQLFSVTGATSVYSFVWEPDNGSFPDGSYTLIINFTNGSVVRTLTVANVRIDTTAPVLVNVSPTTNQSNNRFPLVLVINESHPATSFVTYSLTNATGTPFSGTLLPANFTIVGNQSTFVQNDTFYRLTDGAYQFNVTITDQLGLNTSASYNFTVTDTTPPEIRLYNPPDNLSVTVEYIENTFWWMKTQPHEYNFAANILGWVHPLDVAGSCTFHQEWYSLGFSTYSGSGVLSVNPDANGTLNEYFLNTARPEGFTVLNITCSDDAGNLGGSVKHFLLTDIRGPITSLETPGAQINNSYFSLNVSVADWHPSSTLVNYTLERNGTLVSNDTLSLSSFTPLLYLNSTVFGRTYLSYNYSLDDGLTFTGLLNGNYTLFFQGMDTFNNTANYTWNFTVNDTVDPTMTSSVSSITTTSAILAYTADELANFTVFYGSRVVSGGVSTSGSVVLSGLRAETAYSYVVQACDVNANCENVTGTFTTQAASTSSGGGGGGPPPSSRLDVGPVSRRLMVGSSLSFHTSGSQVHSVTVKQIHADGVTVMLQSEPIEVFLRANESKAVDLDADGVFDVTVTLESFDRMAAKVRVVAYEGAVVVDEPVDNETAEPAEVTAKPVPNESSEQSSEPLVVPVAESEPQLELPPEKSTLGWWVAVLVLLVAGLLVYRRKIFK